MHLIENGKVQRAQHSRNKSDQKQTKKRKEKILVIRDIELHQTDTSLIGDH